MRRSRGIFVLRPGGQSISIVTDTGCITEEIHEVIKGSALLVIEANHDVQMLEFCRYPYNVKRRILGEFGHLSNEAAAAEICRICAETGEYREVLLAHLSKENNFPEGISNSKKSARGAQLIYRKTSEFTYYDERRDESRVYARRVMRRVCAYAERILRYEYNSALRG